MKSVLVLLAVSLVSLASTMAADSNVVGLMMASKLPVPAAALSSGTSKTKRQSPAMAYAYGVEQEPISFAPTEQSADKKPVA